VLKPDPGFPALEAYHFADEMDGMDRGQLGEDWRQSSTRPGPAVWFSDQVGYRSAGDTGQLPGADSGLLIPGKEVITVCMTNTRAKQAGPAIRHDCFQCTIFTLTFDIQLKRITGVKVPQCPHEFCR